MKISVLSLCQIFVTTCKFELSLLGRKIRPLKHARFRALWCGPLNSLSYYFYSIIFEESCKIICQGYFTSLCFWTLKNLRIKNDKICHYMLQPKVSSWILALIICESEWRILLVPWFVWQVTPLKTAPSRGYSSLVYWFSCVSAHLACSVDHNRFIRHKEQSNQLCWLSLVYICWCNL